MQQIMLAKCIFVTLHCLSGQQVWSVLIFLLTFFIKEKSKARLGKPNYEIKAVANYNDRR